MSTSFNHDSSPPKIVIIGGGATGTGIAADAGLRGFKVVLIERGGLGSGTSGRFHGMLHSGARYIVNDPQVAIECYRENQALRKTIPSAISDTGGLFIALNQQEAAHADTIMHACTKAGIPVKEITPKQALQSEPNINSDLKRAFIVPDGSIDGAEVLRLNRQTALAAKQPTTFLTDHIVVALHKNSGAISVVSVKNVSTGEVDHIECDYVVNATGVWAGQITQLAGIELNMIFDKGTMIVFKDQFTRAVLNRCRPEDDGDLLVPHGGQSIMGTTARVIADPDDCLPTQEEADVLLKEGSTLVPVMKHAAVARVYAGVRPLLRDGQLEPNGATRSVSRAFRIVDHADQGVNNFISVVGGKVTLYRRMAAMAVDALCEKLKSR